MTIGVSTSMVHLSYSEREAYTSPYPLGLAVAQQTVTGNVSGGQANFAFLAAGGFLYRLEMFRLQRLPVVSDGCDVISSHKSLTDAAGLGPVTFDLNWICEQTDGILSIYSLPAQAFREIRRLPVGRTDRTALQTVWSAAMPNVDAATYEVTLIMSYWPVTALKEPGFLASFWEAPVVPTLDPSG